MQFISDLLVESIEILEQLANRSASPLDKETIQSLRGQLLEQLLTSAESDKQLIVKIEVSFEGQGNASSWHGKLLAKIDKCFVHNYHKSGASYRLLFSLESSKNINQFTKYCTDIDKTLLENAKIARRNCLRGRIEK